MQRIKKNSERFFNILYDIIDRDDRNRQLSSGNNTLGRVYVPKGRYVILLEVFGKLDIISCYSDSVFHELHRKILYTTHSGTIILIIDNEYRILHGTVHTLREYCDVLVHLGGYSFIYVESVIKKHERENLANNSQQYSTNWAIQGRNSTLKHAPPNHKFISNTVNQKKFGNTKIRK